MRPISFTAAMMVTLAMTLSPPTTTQAADPELIVFGWSGIDDDALYPAYIEKHGEPPTFSFYADEEEAFLKLRQGFRADVGWPCAGAVNRWRDGGLLEPIDTSRIDKWDELMPGMRDMEGFHVEGQQYLIPIDWGSTALTYRSDLVAPADTDSLQAFINPKFADRVSIPDGVDDAYSLALLAVGVRDWNKATDADFDAASDFLRQVHPNVRTYWTDVGELGQLMTSGEVILAWAWSETASVLVDEGTPAVMRRDTAEGYSTGVCGLGKLANAPGSEDKFYDFVNAMLEDRAAEYIVGTWGYGHSSQTGMDKIDPETLASKGLDDFDLYVDRTLWQSPLHHTRREKMIAEFELIKAGF